MNAISKNLNKYYRQINKELICSHKEKKKILSDIKANVRHYLEENPDASFDAIQEHFGTPKQIVEAYIAAIDMPELVRQLNVKNRIVSAVCIALGFCVLLWLGSVIIAIIDNHLSANLIIESYITEE